jgi:endoglycosylceramidase
VVGCVRLCGVRRLIAVLSLLVLAGLVVGCSSDDGGGDDASSDASDPAEAEGEGEQLSPLTAVRGEDPRIEDDQGREVLLRGINLNVLADYPAADDELETVVPLTDEDWGEMAAQGFDVVRLLVSWSSLEPEPGEHDEAYLDEVEAMVREAEAHGTYTVIDVHQDAWGPGIATAEGVDCPDGLEPAIGWSGAPEWATLTGDAETCIGSRREDSDAVRAAWDAFYADEEGIQTALVETWAWVAERFADDPAVAGFDLLNEPGTGSDVDAAVVQLGAFYGQAIEAIRGAEAEAGGFEHPIFFEYTVDGQAVPTDFSDAPGLVFAPHVYGGSIAPVPLDVNIAYVEGLARDYGTTLWIGEHGWFGDEPAEQLPEVRTYGVADDTTFSGGAWWQWRQACGDPHSVGEPDGTPAEEYVVYHRMGCPEGEAVGEDLGVVPEWAEVVTRAYPRATPGQIESLESDGAAGTMHLEATGAEPGSQVDLWVPGDDEPLVLGSGVADVQVDPVDGGGFRVRLEVCIADYQVDVGGGRLMAPFDACPAPG